ncbi:helix-turn-helix transcriptional regulator [Actinocatenispora sera]|uniref:helix-turn-helix domain-containing protein n=1 Tax=Actinocatenispora sera TaxID=390989 RepID=UPI0033D33A64
MSTHANEVSDEVRSAQFAKYMSATINEVAGSRGWSVRQLIAESSVSRETVYRWRRGDWALGKPKPDKVRAFHRALGLDPARALAILGYRSGPEREDPLSLADADVQEYMLAILRRLRDPAESDAERYFIRRTLADLARRPVSSPSETTRGRSRKAG